MHFKPLKKTALALACVSTLGLSWAQTCATAPVTVGFIPKLDTDPYFQVARGGAEEAMKEIGGKLIQAAPSAPTGDAQIEFINNMVAQKVGVIAVSSSDANAISPALRRAKAQGVRVMTYDSDVGVDARSLFVNQAKGDSLAEQMLESMGSLIGYEGEFAILSSTPTAANQNAWIDLMKKKIGAEKKYSKMKLVQVAYGEESEQVNQQQALALVEAYPKIKGIIVPAGIGLPAAARALEQAGRSNVKLTGLAPATMMKKYITAGTAQDIWWNVTDLGYLTYHTAQLLAQCKLTGKPGETFTAGRLGKYTVGRDGEIILGAADIVTPKNLNQFKF